MLVMVAPAKLGGTDNQENLELPDLKALCKLQLHLYETNEQTRSDVEALTEIFAVAL